MGPTRVWYLLGARASTEEPTAALPLLTARAATGGASAGGITRGAVARAVGLEPEVREGRIGAPEARKRFHRGSSPF